MPLPEEVINRLSQEKVSEPGWSTGLLGFAGAVFAITVVLYAGIAFVYTPYINKQINAASANLDHLGRSVDTNQESSLVSLYSQIIHVRSILAGRTVFSPVLIWLAKNTEANVYYSSMSFASGNQIGLTMLARNETDLNQQLAIFEADPNVQSVNISNVAVANVSGYLQSNIVVFLKPSFLTPPQPTQS